MMTWKAAVFVADEAGEVGEDVGRGGDDREQRGPERGLRVLELRVRPSLRAGRGIGLPGEGALSVGRLLGEQRQGRVRVGELLGRVVLARDRVGRLLRLARDRERGLRGVDGGRRPVLLRGREVGLRVGQPAIGDRGVLGRLLGGDDPVRGEPSVDVDLLQRDAVLLDGVALAAEQRPDRGDRVGRRAAEGRGEVGADVDEPVGIARQVARVAAHPLELSADDRGHLLVLGRREPVGRRRRLPVVLDRVRVVLEDRLDCAGRLLEVRRRLRGRARSERDAAEDRGRG